MTEITGEVLDNHQIRRAARPTSAPTSGEQGARTDNRFRDVLGADAWNSLPAAVRRRFSKPLATGSSRIFAGTVVETRLSRAGRLLASLARLVGGPLPTTDGATGPATVVVTEDAGLGGQIWTRTYSRPGRFPQTINSVKRFAGPTGLEEYLGLCLVMRLTLDAEAGTLVFRSAGYDLMLGPWRLAIPALLTPGRCTVTHRDDGPDSGNNSGNDSGNSSGRFSFTLTLDHPWLGRLATQVAHFEETLS